MIVICRRVAADYSFGCHYWSSDNPFLRDTLRRVVATARIELARQHWSAVTDPLPESDGRYDYFLRKRCFVWYQYSVSRVLSLSSEKAQINYGEDKDAEKYCHSWKLLLKSCHFPPIFLCNEVTVCHTIYLLFHSVRGFIADPISGSGSWHLPAPYK